MERWIQRGMITNLFETRGSFPEKTFPGREPCRLEKGVLQNGLDTTQGLNHVGAVGIEIPQLAVVSLACPPERIALHELVEFELGPGAEPLIEAQSAAILLEQGIDAGQAAVPAVFQILQGESPVLLVCFQALL